MRACAEPGAGFSSLGLVDVLEPKEALGKGAHSADPEITRAAPDFGLGKNQVSAKRESLLAGFFMKN